MSKVIILGILIKDRIKEAGRTQMRLSENADIIKSRLGFHEVSEDTCSRNGVILLQLDGNESRCKDFHNQLKEIEGIEVKDMSFDL